MCRCAFFLVRRHCTVRKAVQTAPFMHLTGCRGLAASSPGLCGGIAHAHTVCPPRHAQSAGLQASNSRNSKTVPSVFQNHGRTVPDCSSQAAAIGPSSAAQAQQGAAAPDLEACEDEVRLASSSVFHGVWALIGTCLLFWCAVTALNCRTENFRLALAGSSQHGDRLAVGSADADGCADA